MNAPIEVLIDCDRPLEARALVASFPISLRMSAGAGATLAIVGGGDWPSRGIAAIGNGARRVLVLEPVPVHEDEARRLAEAVRASNARLVLAEATGGHPAIQELRTSLHDDATVVIVTGHAARPVHELVFAEVRIARALGVHITQTAPLGRSEWAAAGTLSAQLNGKDIALQFNATQSDAPEPGYEVHVLGAGHAGLLRLSAANVARPATVQWADAEGRHGTPDRFEAPFRSALQRLLTYATAETNDVVEDWLGDVAVARALAARA